MDKTKKGSDLDFDLDLDLNLNDDIDIDTGNDTKRPDKADNDITLDEIDLKIYRADGQEFKPESSSNHAVEPVITEIEAIQPSTTHQPEKPGPIVKKDPSGPHTSADISHDKTVVLNIDTINQTSTAMDENDESHEFEEITIHSQYLFKDSVEQKKTNPDTKKQNNTNNVSVSRYVEIKDKKPQSGKAETGDHKSWYYAIALVLLLFISLIAWVYFKLSAPSEIFTDNNVTTFKEQRQLPIGGIKTRQPVKTAPLVTTEQAYTDDSYNALPEDTQQAPPLRSNSTEIPVKENNTHQAIPHTRPANAAIKQTNQSTISSSTKSVIKTKHVWALNLPSVPDNREESYAELDRIVSTGIPAEIYEIEIKNIRWYRIRIKGFKSEKAAILYMDTVTKKTGVKKYWTNLISVPVY